MAEIHVPKNITKKELYAYITKLSNKKLDEVQTKYQEQLTALIPQLMEHLKEFVKPVDEILEGLHTLDVTPFENLFGYNGIISNTRSLQFYARNHSGSFSKYCEDTLKGRAKYVSQLLFDENKVIKKLPAEFKIIVQTWNKIVTEYNEKKGEVIKLEEELTSIAKNERKGPQAYKRLAEVGLDMTGLTKSDSSVPDIIRPSIDLSILNSVAKKAVEAE